MNKNNFQISRAKNLIMPIKTIKYANICLQKKQSVVKTTLKNRLNNQRCGIK